MPEPLTSTAPVETLGPPLLLLYRDGLANLNGEACRLLSTQVAAVQLLAPTGPACPHWLLLAPPVGTVGRHTLYGRTDRAGSLRFRAPELAIALFAVLPAGQAALRLQFELAEPGSFQLIPVG